MVPDAARDVGDLVDGAEIQRPPPNARPDGTKEILAQSLVPRSRAGANEGRLFPAKRGRFIIGTSRVHSQHNRGRFRGWPQAQIDATHIAVAVAGAQQFDAAPADPMARVDRT